MRVPCAVLALTLCVGACAPRRPAGPPAGAPVAPVADDVAAALRARMGAAGAEVERFYAARGFRAAWADGTAALRVLERTDSAGEHGLPPARYDAAGARRLLATAGAAARAAFDVAVTAAWLDYAADLAGGVVAPDGVDSMWSKPPATTDLAERLAAALAAGRPAEALDDLAPPFEEYAALRRALGRYRATAARGGWGTVAPGDELGAGAAGERVRALRARLAAGGDLAADPAADAYDAAVEAAVRRFQLRHGLRPDGRVDRATLEQLNVPVERRVLQLALNLERWRWLPRAAAPRYVLINSASFALTLVEQGRVALTLRVIVGRPDWPTPLVSSVLTHVVLHPPWNVPRSIAVGELLPLLRSDPGYAARVGIRVYEGAGGAVRSIDPATIEWSALSDSVFPYQLVQGPGPANPLGRLKLVFANPFNVCVHDTPARSLFAAETRAFSHGCIRADRIADLAGALLRDDPAWPPGAVGRALQRDAERWIALREPVPVHVGYWTAWIGEDGAVQWRPDLYGWDAKVLTAFEAVPPRFPRD